MTQKVFLDACCVINLLNSGFVRFILSNQDIYFFILPIVLDELRGAHHSFVLNNGHLLQLTPDPVVTLDRFQERKLALGLGAGETECMIAAELDDNSFVATDDAKARKIAHALFGNERVTGSLGLVKQAITKQLITLDEGIISVRNMKISGGFFPDLPREFFAID